MRYRSVAAAAAGSASFSAYVVAEHGLVLCVASISEKLVRLIELLCYLSSSLANLYAAFPFLQFLFT